MKGRNILIIGGTKFIGKLLIDLLLKNGDCVTVFSRSAPVERQVMHLAGDRERPTDMAMLQHAIQGQVFDVVYDMCAYNLDHAKDLYLVIGDKAKRLVFFSSAAVYPPTELFPLRENDPTGLHPSFGDYGTNKAAIESFYTEKCATDDVQLTIFRPHYILGPGDYFERHQYVLSRIEQHKPIYVPGDGHALIQFAFSEDVAKLFFAVPRKQKAQLEIVNVAGQQYITLVGFVQLFADALGVTVDIRPTDYAQFGLRNDRFYDDLFLFPNLNLILDCSRATSRYAYKPTPITEYVPRLVEDWQRTKQAYKPQFKEETLFGNTK